MAYLTNYRKISTEVNELVALESSDEKKAMKINLSLALNKKNYLNQFPAQVAIHQMALFLKMMVE